jgi:hypothetical protein
VAMVSDINLENVMEEDREEVLKCEYSRKVFTVDEKDDHLEKICQRDVRYYQQSNNNYLVKKLKNLQFLSFL